MPAPVLAPCKLEGERIHEPACKNRQEHEGAEEEEEVFDPFLGIVLSDKGENERNKSAEDYHQE